MTTTDPGPRSGDDTYDLIGNAPAGLAHRRGVRPGDDLAAITLLAGLIDQAERCLPELVTNARLNGHTWDQIAHALTTSPDEARLRFDPQSPIADPRWPYAHEVVATSQEITVLTVLMASDATCSWLVTGNSVTPLIPITQRNSQRSAIPSTSQLGHHIL
jgi:hypothetical protein